MPLDLPAPSALAPAQGARRPGLRRPEDLPHPPGLPLVGNMFQIRLPQMHQKLEPWAREYGPLYRFALGPQQAVVVADHALATEALKARPDVYKRSARMTDQIHEMGIPPGLFTAEGETWQKQRRMVMASFSPANVRRYHPALQRVTRRLQARWQQAARGGEPVELLPSLMRYTVDVVTGLAFGAEINTIDGGEDVIQRHLDKVFPALFRRITAPVQYWHYVRLPADRQLERSVAAVNEAIAGFIAQARAGMQADPARRSHPTNLLEAMIAAADEADSGLTDVDVAGNVYTMLLAGEDTTANTLAWLICLLHQHPVEGARVAAEVRAVLGDAQDIGIEHLQAMPWLEAATHEALRLRPIAPFNTLEALQDTTLGDLAVPAGTLLFLLARHDSVRPEHCPEPQAFRPARWLGDSDESHVAKRVSMPFGAGPRICPGRYLALLEIKMVAAMLLARFDILGLDTPDGGPPQEHMAFTMAPLGLKLRLRERAV